MSADSRRVERLRAERRRSGTCMDCGGQRAPGRMRCELHLERVRLRTAASYTRKRLGIPPYAKTVWGADDWREASFRMLRVAELARPFRRVDVSLPAMRIARLCNRMARAKE